MGYTVTYQEFAGTSEADHNTIQAFATEDVTLEEVCANCAALRCAAILYDATGFRRGWVHINGEYALR